MRNVPIIVAIAILAIAYIISSLRKKRRSLSLQKESKQISTELIDADRKEQNDENLRFVSQIILGTYTTVSGKSRKKSIKAFDRWQEKENKLWDVASAGQRELLVEYVSGVKNKHSFIPLIQEKNPCKEFKSYPIGYELFLKNVFTDPFPSLHDLPEWAISNKIVELFVAHNISPEDSRCYLLHLKRHYVNHEMTRAIIQFDLWKIPDPKITSRFPNRAKQFAEGTGDW